VVAVDAVLVVVVEAAEVVMEVAEEAEEVSVATKVRPLKSLKRPWSFTSATRSSFANGPWTKRFPISTLVSF
jgi:hypothetical protein